MIRTLFLHLGSEKTASTYLQNILFDNRALLKKFGLVYPIIRGVNLCTQLSIPFGQPNLHSDVLGIHNYSIIYRQLCQALHSEFSSNKYDYILSSELLHARLRSLSEIESLNMFFQKYFDKVQPIVYIRDPWSKALSLYSEMIKARITSLSVEDMCCDYFYYSCSSFTIDTYWKSVFPHITVLDFNLIINNDANPTSLCNSFFYACGLSLDQINSLIVSDFIIKNKSLSFSQARFLSFIYNTLPERMVSNTITYSAIRKFVRFLVLYLFPFFGVKGPSLKSLFTNEDKTHFVNFIRRFGDC